MNRAYIWGTVDGGKFIWVAGEDIQAELHPGSLVKIGFGEIACGGTGKQLYSAHWAAVLEQEGDKFTGITL